MIDNINLLILAPYLNVQLLLDGLLIGAIFVLAAYGLALVWGVMNVKNLAQGDFVIMGGYIAWQVGTWGVNPLFGLPLAIVFMFAFGWAIYYLVIRYVIERDLFTSLLATFGMGLVISQSINLLFGPEVQIADSGLSIRSIYIFGGEVTGHYYFRDFYYADNGLIPALLILVLLSKKNPSLHDPLPTFPPPSRGPRTQTVAKWIRPARFDSRSMSRFPSGKKRTPARPKGAGVCRIQQSVK